eukprot:Lithocolla_globosa_v1_NODE_3724_length_1597_cov_6.837224.p1 type:complete len:101 gc:universal NODE_3724_length_1597_cov_6.837224:991-1293(+)
MTHTAQKSIDFDVFFFVLAKREYLNEKVEKDLTQKQTWEKLNDLLGRKKKNCSKKHQISAETFCNFFTSVGPNLAKAISPSNDDPLTSMKYNSNSSLLFY